MWYLNLQEMRLTKERIAKNGGYRHSLASWISLVIAYLVVFGSIMVAHFQGWLL